MKIRRTANAGVLLELDGVSVLLDGVCREVKPYLATPLPERERLENCWPEIVAFTHAHKDHYDPTFAAAYQRHTNGVIFGPENLPGCKATQEPGEVGGVRITPITSRHIGAAGKTTPHVSFVIEGSKCIWFLGDASVSYWRNKDLPKPDYIIAPYAYAITESAWQFTKSLCSKVVLLHFPNREDDTVGLWDAMERVVTNFDSVFVPKMGQTYALD